MPCLPVPRSVMARDLLLGVALTALAEVELVLVADQVEGALLWHYLSNLLMVPAVGLRRRAPLVGMLFVSAGLVSQPLVGSSPVATPYLTLLFLLVSLGWYAPTLVGLVGVGLTLASGLVYDFTRREILVGDLVVNAALVVLAWAAGHTVRRATDRRIRAELKADRAARDAALRERERISRELHDSIAHALTLITLQAGGARERSDQRLAVETFASIEQSGREALADMHRFLALMGGSDGEAPGIGHLDDLVAGVRRGGLVVDVDSDVTAPDVPGSVSSTVYRIVQEALTNVVRHSGARRAHVSVLREAQTIVARVTDDGSPVASRVPGSGRGLEGLRERLLLFGGTLESGPTPEGWRLEARIPFTESAP